MLEPTTVNEYTIKDSFYFAEKLLFYDPNLVIASFNVELLFKNIPLQETIVDIVFQANTFTDGLTKNHHYHYFQVANDEVVMGSPLGSTLSNIFLCYSEQVWLENCLLEFKLVVYRR